MKSDTPSLRFEKNIKAPVKDVYRVFTKQAAITGWLCSMASIDVDMQTRLYLWWDNGYYTCGEFIKVTPEKELIFSWLGKEDPGKTRVRVTFKPADSGTHLVIEHRGMKDTPKWQPTVKQIQHGWEVALDNLVSILENGQDLRIVNRPMVGINLDEFTAEKAAKLGVPVNRGILIDGTMEGMGAQRCGLQKNDVMVEIDGHRLLGPHALNPILRGKKAGDTVEIVFYRGPQKHAVTLDLSPRPVLEIPGDQTELAQWVAQMFEEGDQAMEGALEGVTEAEASFKPSLTSWNVKEVLAHLIHTERDWQFAIQRWLINEEANYVPNVESRIRSTVAIYPTVPDLFLELKRAEAETVEVLRNLPKDFTAQKDSFWAMAYNQVQFKGHSMEHVDQVKADVAEARKR